MTTLIRFDDQDAELEREAGLPRILRLVPGEIETVPPEHEEHVPHGPELAPVARLERRERLYRRWLAVADGVAGLAATLLACLAENVDPTWLVVFVPMLAVAIAKIEGLYDRDDQVIQKTNIAEWRTILQTSAITSIGVYLSWTVLTDAPHGGGMRVFFLLAVLAFALGVGSRMIARRVARHLSPTERCLIVGDPQRVLGLAQRLTDAQGVELIGMLPEDALSGSVAQLKTVVEELDFHRLVISPSGEPNASTLHLVQAARFIGVRVSLVPSVMAAVGGFAIIEELDGLTLLGVPRFGLSRSSSALKRVFDVFVGAAAAVVFSPLMLMIAVAIKLDTKGPVLFRQTRTGRGGRPFQILKFRSMVDGADRLKQGLQAQNEAGDGLFKIADDPRITRVGRYIRATHLDELPQLANVLRGEMSLVGPRPLVQEEDAQVKGRDRHRIHLTPGMTGPWQVRGPMNTPLAEMAMLDYLYASSWSIWQDVDILLRTVARMVARRGH